MVEVNWTAYESAATVISTDMNSDADDALAISAAQDNSTALDFYIDIEAYLASVDLSGQTNPALHIWVLTCFDGTNFEDGSASVTPARAPDCIIPLREFNGVQRVTMRLISIPPEEYKILYKNKTGATLAASGNTIKVREYSEAAA